MENDTTRLSFLNSTEESQSDVFGTTCVNDRIHIFWVHYPFKNWEIGFNRPGTGTNNTIKHNKEVYKHKNTSNGTNMTNIKRITRTCVFVLQF